MAGGEPFAGFCDFGALQVSQFHGHHFTGGGRTRARIQQFCVPVTRHHLGGGLVFSQPVLLALVAAGMTRDDAYRVVQRNAMATWDQQRPFRELLDVDPEVTAVLSAADLDAAFDLDRALVNVERTLAALAPLR